MNRWSAWNVGATPGGLARAGDLGYAPHLEPAAMTPIKNLCYRSDAIFHLRDGFVEEHADYFAIRTPSNPSFWFGNFILFKRAPMPGDLSRWLQIHEHIFGSALNHITLGWDEDHPGVTGEFVDAGFKIQDGIGLSIAAYENPVATNPDLVVRRLRSDSEWKQMVDLQIEIDREDFQYGGDNGDFRTTQMNSLRAMAEEGRGDWWGAFDQDSEAVIGGMGLYFDADHTFGRFQYVTTRSTSRRQRVCTTILDHVVRHAFETFHPEQLVISTGADSAGSSASVQPGFRTGCLAVSSVQPSRWWRCANGYMWQTTACGSTI